MRIGLNILLLITCLLLLKVEAEAVVLDGGQATIHTSSDHHAISTASAPVNKAEEEEVKREKSDSADMCGVGVENGLQSRNSVRPTTPVILSHGRCGNRAILTDQGRLQI